MGSTGLCLGLLERSFGRLQILLSRWTGDGLGLLNYEIEGVGTGYGHEGLINGFTANVASVPTAGLTLAMASNFQQTNSMEALGDPSLTPSPQAARSRWYSLPGVVSGTRVAQTSERRS